MFDKSFQGYGIILYQKIGELTIWFDNCGQKKITRLRKNSMNKSLKTLKKKINANK